MIERKCPYENELKYRYPKEAVRRFNELKQDEEFLRRYELFERNIDYRTGERITHGSFRYKELVREFTISNYDYGRRNSDYVYFGNVKDINYEDYLKECDEIDKRNISIKKRNKRISIVEKEIEKLKRWNDYAIFEKRKYGVPKILDDEHREDDCFGDVIYNECCDVSICKKCFECIH